jgi:hypothetical protein
VAFHAACPGAECAASPAPQTSQEGHMLAREPAVVMEEVVGDQQISGGRACAKSASQLKKLNPLKRKDIP